MVRGMTVQYVQFLHQVLGLSKLLLPQEQEASRVEPAAGTRESADKGPRVIFVAEKVWTSAGLALFEKMREAMKLSPEQGQVLFADQRPVPELQVKCLLAERIVCFSPRLEELLQVPREFKTCTVDPEELLINPGLKSQAWNDLKQVMRALGTL